jgi:predicted glycoside hydrolase/deacetylase ChbG (UPF0249 family)
MAASRTLESPEPPELAMIIVNADDYGRSRNETDRALSCYQRGGITSATAMVFMEDSERAAKLVEGSGIDLGLHLNLSQPFTGHAGSAAVRADHERVVRFIASAKYARCIYNPALRRQFHDTFQAQLDEFVRLYGRRPSHVDGHHHAHLSTNMLMDRVIPANERVRRSFTFKPREKSIVNRAYRRLIDFSLARRYKVTDYFFSLEDCLRNPPRMAEMFELSREATVELETHPANHAEYAYLTSDKYAKAVQQLHMGTYASI